mgnify:CR=1 FL=1
MIFKDYYKILGLETNKVSMEEIKKAFREEAKKFHPDVNVNNKFAEERFKDINEAYRILSTPATKRKYDRQWNSHIGNKNKKQETKRTTESIFSEFINMFVGDIEEKKLNNKKSSKEAQKGENIETGIDVSIEEAFYGVTKKISLRTVDGKMKTFSIKVPEGIRNNEKIRLIGQGKLGVNGGKNGDLFIKIHIEQSNKFKLSGYDLSTDLYLTPSEAALGTRVNMESIDDTVQVYIPAGIASGEKVKIAGKGYKDGKGGRGDLIAQIKIAVPKKLTKKEKELYEKLQKVSTFNPRSK